jgi:hypothetical protein
MNEDVKEQRQRLTADCHVTPGGEFEIIAISAGEGNGWKFSEECLNESLPLWERVECFVDHSWFGHSVRDLGGVCHSPCWDAERRGVRMKLKPLGPSALILTELGRQMIAEQVKPRIGFSADVVFSAQGKAVGKILRVLSVDLVYNPARGGEFIRALNHRLSMNEQESLDKKERMNPMEEMKAGQDASGQDALGEMQQKIDRLNSVRQELDDTLLEVALHASRLPAAAQEMVRARFKGTDYNNDEVKAAVEQARDLVGELTAGRVVQGPGRVSGMMDSRDQLQCAVDDLLGAPRDADKQKVSVHKLSGIRELYLMLTGDHDLHGGYHPDRAQLAVTADFSGLVKNALNKVVANRWQELGRAGYNWWERLVTVEHFTSLNTITGTLVGTVGSLPVVAEGAEYTELAVGDSPETADFVKYGGYIPLTLELIDRDETRKLRAYPRELANAGLRKISELVAAIFTANSGVGPTLADGGALFNANAVSAAGGHANLRTTDLGSGEWDAVQTAVYNQPMLVKNASGYYGAGAKMGVNPRYLLVPRALQLTAMKLLYPTLENAATIFSENQQRGQPGDVITVPEWTDADDWAAVCDPRVAPAVFLGERFGIQPEIFIAGDELSPAVFTNDEHRLKVRHFLAVWVNDFRPLHKSNVE